MNKGRAIAIAVTMGICILVAFLLVIAFRANLFLSGDYYVRIDNTHLSQNEDTGGIVHLRSGEPYIYELDAVNEAGDGAKIEFGVSRELRQDALLKLELQPIRGVVSWSEVHEDELPPKAAEALD